MKAIVVRQPYAALIVAGVKTIETRPAPPNGPMRPQGVRGLPGLAIEPGERIAICAAATKPKEGDPVGRWECVKMMSGRWWAEAPFGSGAEPLQLHFGAVVGTVGVAEALEMRRGCGPDDHIHLYYDPTETFAPPGMWVPDTRRDNGNEQSELDVDYPLGEFAPGRWGWLLDAPLPCAPVPVTGKQGVFTLPVDGAERVP